MIKKKWILMLAVIFAFNSWRLSCYLVFQFLEDLPPTVFKLCRQPYSKFVFCSNFVPSSEHGSSPYKLSTLPSDDYTTLINIKDFRFLNLPKCGRNSSLLLVAVVHSAPANFKRRQSIRSTWGTVIQTFFMVGEANTTSLARKLNQEIVEFGDIVQGSFRDSYRNLTYKHTMTLKWVSYWCQNAKYVLKTDDDLFVHASNLHKFLRLNLARHGVRQLILCQKSVKDFIQRTFRSKWRTDFKDYSGSSFPSFCVGAAIVYSPDVVFKLYSEAQKAPYFWIDDVHITGTVASQVNISLTNIGYKLFRWEDVIETNKLERDLIFCLTKRPEQVTLLWEHYQSLLPSYFIETN